MNVDKPKSDYDAKAFSYFEETRPEMQAYVPPDCRRLLDVGCGTGGFGAALKSARKIEVWGVEPFESAAAQAQSRFDRVITSGFHSQLGLPAGTFDCVTFNDVLEHLIEPELSIRYARTLLSPEGVVVSSIPNIRHFPTLWRLAVHGEWQYREWGTLDKTHMRFFTRSSICAMFEAEGYQIESVAGIHPYKGVPNVSRRVWRIYKLMTLLSRRRFEDLKFERFAVVARPIRAR